MFTNNYLKLRISFRLYKIRLPQSVIGLVIQKNSRGGDLCYAKITKAILGR